MRYFYALRPDLATAYVTGEWAALTTEERNALMDFVDSVKRRVAMQNPGYTSIVNTEEPDTRADYCAVTRFYGPVTTVSVYVQ